ncbi:MAG TPA: T9SS type A sorting domain-containing protein, partial [Chitinophagales bacterium]|nr:T9SS type A sorting domain-containing protein [Chitinophagales bacterium]
VYYDTLTAVGGCDSIVILNLTVNTPGTGAINATVCNGQSYLFNGIGLTTAGVYYDTLVNAAGCDSILTLTLTVQTAVNSSISQTICNGSSYLFNDQQLTQAGVYYDTLQAANSCDSVVTLTLTVSTGIVSSFNDTICEGDSYLFNGTNLIQAGEYYDTLQATNGCDSIVTLYLALDALPQPVISRTGDTLTTQVYASYQWLKNNAAISGANSQTLVLTQTGNYSVVVSDANGCSDTSALLNVLSVGIGNIVANYGVKLYPNPNTGNFVIEFTDDEQRFVEITDAIGRLITSGEVMRRKEFALDNVATGIYFLNIRSNGTLSGLKFSIIRLN